MSLDFNDNQIPDECECLGGLDADADIDGSGNCIVALNDLAQLLGNCGITTGATPDQADIDPPPDGDGDVDIADLAALLGQYGDDCN